MIDSRIEDFAIEICHMFNDGGPTKPEDIYRILEEIYELGMQAQEEQTDYNNLWDNLEGFYAYDEGCTDSGIHDELLKSRCFEMLHKMSKPELIEFLSTSIKEAYLSDEAKKQGYTKEDVDNFIDWLDHNGFVFNCKELEIKEDD